MSQNCENEYIGEFCTRSGASYPVSIDYTDSNALPTGESVVSGVVTAWNLTTNEDASSEVLASPATVTVATNVASFIVNYGTQGYEYELRLVVTTTSGYTIPDTLRMKSI